VTEPKQSFGEARRDAMSEADSDARPLRFDSPYSNSIDARTSPNSAQIVQNNRDITPLAIIALLLGTLGFFMGAIALLNSSKVAEFAFIAGEAKSKAETATARANVSEIYSKQLFTEMNRLGYPIRTPAEEHAPQPTGNVSEVPEQ
jgi:hypothetical protein